jgi:hypothetical protein
LGLAFAFLVELLLIQPPKATRRSRAFWDPLLLSIPYPMVDAICFTSHLAGGGSPYCSSVMDTRPQHRGTRVTSFGRIPRRYGIV